MTKKEKWNFTIPLKSFWKWMFTRWYFYVLFIFSIYHNYTTLLWYAFLQILPFCFLNTLWNMAIIFWIIKLWNYIINKITNKLKKRKEKGKGGE